MVFVSFNDDDDDDDKGARLCDDAMMRGQKEKEKREMTMRIPLNVWSSRSSVVSSICCCSKFSAKRRRGPFNPPSSSTPVVVDDDDGFPKMCSCT